MLNKPLEQGAVEKTDAEKARDKEREQYRENSKAEIYPTWKRWRVPIGKDEDILALSWPPYYIRLSQSFHSKTSLRKMVNLMMKLQTISPRTFCLRRKRRESDPLYNAHGLPTQSPYKQ